MDNTLLDDNDPPRIKLCDFGFARWWSGAPHMSTITGTPDYMSPQLLGPKARNQKALYDGTKADIWASGVLLCVMLIGRFPFEGTEMSNATNLEDVSLHVSCRHALVAWLPCAVDHSMYQQSGIGVGRQTGLINIVFSCNGHVTAYCLLLQDVFC